MIQSTPGSTPTLYTAAQVPRLGTLLHAIATEIQDRETELLELEREQLTPALRRERGFALKEASARQRRGLAEAYRELEDLGLTVMLLHPLTVSIPTRDGDDERRILWSVDS